LEDREKATGDRRWPGDVFLVSLQGAYKTDKLEQNDSRYAPLVKRLQSLQKEEREALNSNVAMRKPHSARSLVLAHPRLTICIPSIQRRLIELGFEPADVEEALNDEDCPGLQEGGPTIPDSSTLPPLQI